MMRRDLLPGDRFRYGGEEGAPQCWEVTPEGHDRQLSGPSRCIPSGVAAPTAEHLDWEVMSVTRAAMHGWRPSDLAEAAP